jgi:hypothetical protein
MKNCIHVYWGTIPPLYDVTLRLDVWSSIPTLSSTPTKMVDRGLVAGLLESSAGEWVMIISLVFGGCCSYVPALAYTYRDETDQ